MRIRTAAWVAAAMLLVGQAVAQVGHPAKGSWLGFWGPDAKQQHRVVLLLDWRDMVAHYPGARHRVIQGSDHGISDFAEYQDEVLAFAGIDTRTGA